MAINPYKMLDMPVNVQRTEWINTIGTPQGAVEAIDYICKSLAGAVQQYTKKIATKIASMDTDKGGSYSNIVEVAMYGGELSESILEIVEAVKYLTGLDS